jgi:hypothetical protein
MQQLQPRYWNVPTSDIATYLLRTDVSYATAAVKWQQK